MNGEMRVGRLSDPAAPTQAELDAMPVVGYVSDGTTKEDLEQQWADVAQAQKDRAAFEGNRADRRARERENRRAVKAAAIQAIGRTL